MTNGEKMKSVFGLDRNILETPEYSYIVPIDWWNAEYKEPTTKNEAKYCDRNICLKNEYNNIGCEDCEVTKSREPTTQERQAESDKFDAAFQDGYDHGYAQARFDYEQEPTTKNDSPVDHTINGLDDFIEFGKKAFGVELTIKKSDNPDTYAKLFGTNKNDLVLIHTEGLDEEIRCTMCTNYMKSDRGCDGSCVVDKDMYKAVMDAIEKRIQSTTKNNLGVDCVSRADALDCVNWGYSFSDIYKKINELPSVTPQESYPCDTCKHNNDPWYTEPCDSCCGSDGYEQKYIEREVLDRIKAKIEQSRYGLDDGLDLALNIIDECVAETEDT